MSTYRMMGRYGGGAAPPGGYGGAKGSLQLVEFRTLSKSSVGAHLQTTSMHGHAVGHGLQWPTGSSTVRVGPSIKDATE